ncbi:MAG: pyridoxal phosphate-dependent aminotransferase [Sandaracinaceae bacterium]
MARRADDRNLNENVRGLRPSATVSINEHSDALIADGQAIVKLGLGQSPFPVPPPVVAALREHAAEKGYLPVRGLFELRRAVAHYTERHAGIDRTAEDVLIGPGSKELMFLLQLVFDGELMIPTPAWVSYAPQAHILGRRVRLVHTTSQTGWMLTPEELERACVEAGDAPRILILTYPSNPTGLTFKTEQLRAFAAIAREHRLVVLSDEIYGELHHKGQHVSIARFYPEGTIISAGLSKWCGAGGWRLGTFVFPQELRWLLDAMSAVASETYTSTSAPIQYAAVTAFDGGPEIDAYLASARRVLSALGRWSARQLREAGLVCPHPSGAFYLFVDFEPHRTVLAARGITTSRELCAALLRDTGVAILPGEVFGRAPEELTARLAYVDFDGHKALDAVAVIPRQQPLDVTFLRRHCRRVVNAIEAIAEWTEAR